MAEDAFPGFWDMQKQVAAIKQTVEDVAAIAEAVGKAGRSAVCTIVNNTDIPLVRVDTQAVHGTFATAPPATIGPRSGGAFGVQSSAFSLATGAAGAVFYAGGAMLLRCGWEVPWIGSNGAETTWRRQDGREDLTGRYRTWDTASGGNKQVPMDFVVTQVPEQHAWRFCRHCGLLFYDGYEWKGACAKPLPTTRFNPGKMDVDLKLYEKPRLWESFVPGGTSPWRNGTEPPVPPAPPAPPAPVKRRQHEASGFLFTLCHSIPSLSYQQAGWRFCTKCHALFFDGFPDDGACPGGGGHSRAGHVFLLTNDTPAESWVKEQQPGWRFCQKCYGLFFDGFDNDKGVCFAGSGHQWNALDQPPPSRHFILNHQS